MGRASSGSFGFGDRDVRKKHIEAAHKVYKLLLAGGIESYAAFVLSVRAVEPWDNDTDTGKFGSVGLEQFQKFVSDAEAEVK